MKPREAVGYIAASHEALELAEHEARNAALRRLELVQKEGQTLTHDLVENVSSRSSPFDGGGHEPGKSKTP